MEWDLVNWVLWRDRADGLVEEVVVVEDGEVEVGVCVGGWGCGDDDDDGVGVSMGLVPSLPSTS